MPKTPKDLSEIIREMAQKQAKDRDRTLDEKAADRIATIPAPYRSQETISVSLSELETMISDIIDIAAPLTESVIGLHEMDQALDEVRCHYLWFC